MVNVHKRKEAVHQEYAIAKPGQRVQCAPTIRLIRAGGPFAGHRGAESDDQCETVEEHVYSIAEKTKGAADPTIECLDDHEGEVQATNILATLTYQRLL